MAHYKTIDLLKITNLNLKSNATSCVCGLEDKGGSDSIDCTQCSRSFHKTCLKLKRTTKLLCPVCFMNVMDPLSEVQQCYFVGTAKGKFNEIMSYKAQIGAFEGFKQNVQLRCIRLRQNYLKDHSWPNCCEIYSNDMNIVTCKPLGQHASTKKRKDHAKTIKNYRAQNTIKIIYTYDRYREDQYRIEPDEFLFGVFRVRPLSQQQLLTKIINYNTKIEPRSIISEVLRQNENSELRTEQIEIGLLCPYTAMPIKIPARGGNCSHVKCFDVKGIIWAHRKERTWKCPHCNESCQKIIIDKTIKDIIQGCSKPIKSVIFTSQIEKYKVIEKSDDEQEEEQSEKVEPKKKIPTFIVLDDEQDVEVPCIFQENIQNKTKESKESKRPNESKRPDMLLQPRQFQPFQCQQPDPIESVISQYRHRLESLRQGRFSIDRPLSRFRELQCVKLYRQLFEL